MKKINNNAGFSLIQVLMTMGIMGIISMTLLSQQNIMNKVKRDSEYNLEVTKFQMTMQSVIANHCTNILENLNILDYYEENHDESEETLLTRLRSDETISYITQSGSQRDLMQPYTSFIPYQSDFDIKNSKAFFTGIKVTQSGPHKLHLKFTISKHYQQRSTVQGETPSSKKNYLGFREKEYDVPIFFRKISENNFHCTFADSELHIGEFSCPSGESLVGFGDFGAPICEKLDDEDDNPSHKATVSFTPSLESEVSSDKKNDYSMCNGQTSPIGLKYRRNFWNKEFTSSLCAKNVKLSFKTYGTSGEVINERTASQIGYYEEKSFQGKTARHTWGHCPEGSVMSSFKVTNSREVFYRCAPLKFKFDDSQISCPAHLDYDEITFRIESYQSQLAQKRLELIEAREDEGNSGTSIQRIIEIMKELKQLLAAEESNRESCEEGLAITTKDIHTKIIAKTSEQTASCEKGFFLSGIYLEKDNKDNFRIKCSSMLISNTKS